MREIVIHKQGLLAAGLVIGLIVSGIWLLPRLLTSEDSVNTGAGEIAPYVQNPAPIEDDAQLAAIAGAQAFYTMDHTSGQQVWLDQLCRVSTQIGCTAYQNVIVPALWPALEMAQTTTTAKVSAEEMVLEQVAPSRGNASIQIWRLQIYLSSPWPMQEDPVLDFPALALVVQEAEVWKFERFLTEEEVQAVWGEGTP
jgi:hypothetical protein